MKVCLRDRAQDEEDLRKVFLKKAILSEKTVVPVMDCTTESDGIDVDCRDALCAKWLIKTTRAEVPGIRSKKPEQ